LLTTNCFTNDTAPGYLHIFTRKSSQVKNGKRKITSAYAGINKSNKSFYLLACAQAPGIKKHIIV
jgi:hypothetical protein